MGRAPAPATAPAPAIVTCAAAGIGGEGGGRPDIAPPSPPSSGTEAAAPSSDGAPGTRWLPDEDSGEGSLPVAAVMASGRGGFGNGRGRWLEGISADPSLSFFTYSLSLSLSLH